MSPLRPLAGLCLAALFVGPAFAEDAPADEAPVEKAAAPTTYTLGAGQLVVQVFKDPDTLASGLSHDHAIRASGWSGSFTWNPADSSCAVDITLPVSGLTPDEDRIRKQYGLEGTLDEGMREDIKENMLSDHQLHGKKFPNITFKASSCALSGDTLNVTGALNIRGEDKQVVIPLAGFSADGSQMSGKGSFKAALSDFGAEPYSALFGQLKNRDDMTFHVSVKGKAQ